MADLTPNNREEYWLKGMVDGQTTLEPNKRREFWYKEIVDAIGSGGGGGTGGGAVIVNVNSSTGAIDKTAKELYDAMDTQIVLFKASVSPAEGAVVDFYAIVEQRSLTNGSLYAFDYSSITGKFPYDGIKNAPCSANDYPILTPQ